MQEELKEKNENMKSYSVFSSMGNNIKEKIYTLKIDQKNLEEKLNDIVNIQNSISKFKMDISKEANGIDNLEFIEKHRDEIEELLNFYKEGLKELKYKIESQSYSKPEGSLKNSHKKIKFVYLTGILSVLIFVYAIINQIIPACYNMYTYIYYTNKIVFKIFCSNKKY